MRIKIGSHFVGVFVPSPDFYNLFGESCMKTTQTPHVNITFSMLSVLQEREMIYDAFPV